MERSKEKPNLKIAAESVDRTRQQKVDRQSIRTSGECSVQRGVRGFAALRSFFSFLRTTRASSSVALVPIAKRTAVTCFFRLEVISELPQNIVLTLPGMGIEARGLPIELRIQRKFRAGFSLFDDVNDQPQSAFLGGGKGSFSLRNTLYAIPSDCLKQRMKRAGKRKWGAFTLQAF
ncbi:MAG: hypothetical protein Greene101449_159 [Candidatus Peregrinibacteria bacterium Greene1014_49]|nr:MAG: hypothetical protein Greene101449_159 [Candidatus Peregrinibacteria bacterium Greene1014_49]